MRKIWLVPIVGAILLSACSGRSTVNQNTDSLKLLQTPIPTVEPTAAPIGSMQPSASPLVNKTMPPTTGAAKEKIMTHATIHTAKGNIVLELYPDKAPGTVSNFEAKAGSGYYKNLTFHRVEDWVIQGGDPVGNGTGGGSMPTELNDVPFVEGSLGVARGGDIKVSNDSQFFICTQDCSWLNGQYTNFGKVTQGMDVVKQIAIGDKIESISLSE